MTATNDVALRRTLYLTIMSAASYEEAGHKLLKMRLPAGKEGELCRMIVDCCSQERTFLRFYALLAQRFCVKFLAYRRAPPPPAPVPRRAAPPLCRTAAPTLPARKRSWRADCTQTLRGALVSEFPVPNCPVPNCSSAAVQRGVGV